MVEFLNALLKLQVWSILISVQEFTPGITSTGLSDILTFIGSIKKRTTKIWSLSKINILNIPAKIR
jgi:hypothetical protein